MIRNIYVIIINVEYIFCVFLYFIFIDSVLMLVFLLCFMFLILLVCNIVVVRSVVGIDIINDCNVNLCICK